MNPLAQTHLDADPLTHSSTMSLAVSSQTLMALEENAFLKYLQSLRTPPETEKLDSFILQTFSHEKAEYIIERASELGPITSAKMSFKADQPIDIVGIKACASSFTEPIVSLQLIAGHKDDIVKLESAIEAFASNSKTSLKIDFNAQALSQGWAPERTKQLNDAVNVLNEATSPAAAILAIAQIKKLLSPEKTFEADRELQQIGKGSAQLAAAAGQIFQQASAIRAAKAVATEAELELASAKGEQLKAQANHFQASQAHTDALALLARQTVAAQELETLRAQRVPLEEQVSLNILAVASAQERLASHIKETARVKEEIIFCGEEIAQLDKTLSTKSSQLNTANETFDETHDLFHEYSSKIAALKKEIETLGPQIVSEREQINTHGGQIQLYTSEIESLQQEIAVLERERSVLASEISSVLAPEQLALQEQLAAAQKAEATALRERDELQSRSARLTEALPSTQASFEQTEGSLRAASEQEETIKSNLSAARALSEANEQELSRLQPLIDKQQTLVGEAAKELARVSAEIQRLTTQERSLNSQITEAQAGEDASIKSVAVLKESLKSLDSELIDTQARKKQLESETNTAIDDVISIQQQFLTSFRTLNENVTLIAPEGSPLHSQVQSIIEHITQIAAMTSVPLNDAQAHNAEKTVSNSAQNRHDMIAASVRTLNDALSTLNNIMAPAKKSTFQKVLESFGLREKPESAFEIQNKIQSFEQYCLSFIKDGLKLAEKVSAANTKQKAFFESNHNISILKTQHEATSGALITAQRQLERQQNTLSVLGSKLRETQQKLGTSNGTSLMAKELLSTAETKLLALSALKDTALSNIGSIKIDIDKYKALMTQGSEHVAELSRHHASAKENLESTRSAIREIEVMLPVANEKLTAREEERSSLEAQISVLSSKQQELETALAAHTDRIAILRTNIEEISRTKTALLEKTALMSTALLARADALQKKEATVAETSALLAKLPDITGLRAEISILESRCTQLLERKEQLTQRTLPELERTKVATEAAIDPAIAIVGEERRLLENAQHQLETHDGLIATTQIRHASLHAECERINMPQIEKDLATNAQLLETAAQKVATTTTALENKVAILAELQRDQPRGVKALQISETLSSQESENTAAAQGATVNRDNFPPIAPIFSHSSPALAPGVDTASLILPLPEKPPQTTNTVVNPPCHKTHLVRGSLAILQRDTTKHHNKLG